mmetsp:Transcript_21617/g.52720  ORF Transcript_21617/g.52720 Transcript_21617/m.52720 type:complete len:716 (+) Transcript_21617:42-2189(+)
MPELTRTNTVLRHVETAPTKKPLPVKKRRRRRSPDLNKTHKGRYQVEHQLQFLEATLPEETVVLTPSKFLINPEESKVMRRWDVVTSFALLWTCWVTPVQIGFEDLGVNFAFVVGRFVDLVFMFDMMLQFFVMYRDTNGRLVSEKRSIAKRYLETWFLPDAVSVVPVDLIVLVVPDGTAPRQLRIMKLARMLRFVKLLRFIRMSRVLQKLRANITFSYALVGIMNFGGLLLMTTHWLACGLGATALAEENEDGNWLDMAGVSDASVGVKWITAMYWATTIQTGISMGDIGPVTSIERLLAAILTLVCGSAWALFVSVFLMGVLTSLTKDSAESKSKVDEVSSMLSAHGVFNHRLTTNIRSYLLDLTSVRKSKLAAITQILSPALQADMVLARFSHEAVNWIDKIWYFRGTSREFVVDILQTASEECYLKREVFSRPWTLYALIRGSVSRRGKHLFAGDIWGQDQVLIHSWLLLEHVQVAALSFVHVSSLSRHSLDQILWKFPLEKRLIRKAYCRAVLRAGIKREANRRRGILADPEMVAAVAFVARVYPDLAPSGQPTPGTAPEQFAASRAAMIGMKSILEAANTSMLKEIEARGQKIQSSLEPVEAEATAVANTAAMLRNWGQFRKQELNALAAEDPFQKKIQSKHHQVVDIGFWHFPTKTTEAKSDIVAQKQENYRRVGGEPVDARKKRHEEHKARYREERLGRSRLESGGQD